MANDFVVLWLNRIKPKPPIEFSTVRILRENVGKCASLLAPDFPRPSQACDSPCKSVCVCFALTLKCYKMYPVVF